MKQNSGEHSFSATVEVMDFGRMVYAVVYVPEDVLELLGVATRARVIGTVSGMAFRGAILPAGGGQQYLLLSEKFLKSAGLAVGDVASVRLRLDDPDAVELVPEFERALSLNPTAQKAWDRLTPGARRGHAHRIATAKQPTTRRARIETCLDMLCENAGEE
jgi:hypothetical protein